MFKRTKKKTDGNEELTTEAWEKLNKDRFGENFGWGKDEDQADQIDDEDETPEIDFS